MIDSVKPVGLAERASAVKGAKQSTAEGQKEEGAYSVDLSSSKSKKPSAEQIAAIKKQVEAQNAALRDLVAKLLYKQNSTAATAFKEIDFNPDMTPEEAQKAISEDGEWGINAVSDRIVAFAIAISGNDASKLDTLKAAIDKGFEQASAALGGQLPDICSRTYDAIMQKLDSWAKNGSVDVQA